MKTLVLPQERTILKGGYFLSQNGKELKEINLLDDLFWLWHALCYFQLHIRQSMLLIRSIKELGLLSM